MPKTDKPIKHAKNMNGKVAQQNGAQFRIKIHTSFNLTMTGVNARRVDIALRPQDFDMFSRFANLY